MAAHSLPQEVTEHLEAAIELSNRRVYLRFLDEAKGLRTRNFPAAAVLSLALSWNESSLANKARKAPKSGNDWKDGHNCGTVSLMLMVGLP